LKLISRNELESCTDVLFRSRIRSAVQKQIILKSKNMPDQTDLKLQHITDDSPVACVSTQSTPIAHRK